MEKEYLTLSNITIRLLKRDELSVVASNCHDLNWPFGMHSLQLMYDLDSSGFFCAVDHNGKIICKYLTVMHCISSCYLTQAVSSPKSVLVKVGISQWVAGWVGLSEVVQRIT